MRRFAGDIFPPIVVFKLFLKRTEVAGCKVVYMSGQNTIKPATEVIYI